MSSSGNPTGMPNINQPFTGAGNIITRPWFLLLQTFFNRTGGAPGGIIVPTGSVLDFAGTISNIPLGFIQCGQAVSRTKYASLFSVIGVIWGIGNGETTFDLPPQSGAFIKIIAT